jgi:ABC-type Fe3+-siderophore transport system permease subunit
LKPSPAKRLVIPKALAALSSRKPAKQLGLPSTSLLVRSLLTTPLAGAAEVSFVVTNSFVGLNDVPVVAVRSGASTGTYVASVSAVAAGSFTITLSNLGSTASEALVLNYAIIKGAEA